MTDKIFRVVLAEDEYFVAEEITMLLNQFGHQVVGRARNGEEAVEMTRELQPDVTLLDIKMPRLNGLEAAEKIRDLYPVPTVILTSYDDRGLVEDATETGVSAYLVKPPRPEELDRTLLVATARFSDMQKLAEKNRLLEEQRRKMEKMLEEIRRLQGILPICSSCKKIRKDDGAWQGLEEYIREHAEVEFSHGICPECRQKLYPDFDLEKK